MYAARAAGAAAAEGRGPGYGRARSGWQRECKRMMRTTVEFDACYNRASSPVMEVGRNEARTGLRSL
jgi:hypothetical protein